MIQHIFTNRQNKVIMDNRLSDTYDVITGIDQGEVISPLLWLIYYDPLYELLENYTSGFNTSSIFYPELYNTSKDLVLNFKVHIVGYLDDSMIFSSS